MPIQINVTAKHSADVDPSFMSGLTDEAYNRLEAALEAAGFKVGAVIAKDDEPIVCRHCEATLEVEPSVGLVDALSGDDGGTYDVCPESPNRKHEAL